ncbi:MAG: hypothetical protein K2X35_14450 [Bryobacteraceae bacterium]|nr:hypothetical protein [Bryobacteraceae bacterium]
MFRLAMSYYSPVADSSLPLAEALAKALGHGPGAIAENRKGRLADDQAVRLKARIAGPLFAAVLALVVWVAFWLSFCIGIRNMGAVEALAGVAAYFFRPHLWFHPLTLTGTNREPLIFSMAAFSLFWLICFLAMQVPLRVVWDIRAREVVSKRGRIARVRTEQLRRGMPGPRHWTFVMQEQKFEVTEELYEALDEGRIYDVFYGRRSKILVGLDPASEESDPLLKKTAGS